MEWQVMKSRRRLTTRRWLTVGLTFLLVVVAAAFAVLFPLWRTASRSGGQGYATPFRIAGNLYYVGATDISAFLITSPEGHILIGDGYPASPSLIRASIAELGFNIRDVKVLLNSEPGYDHAGGLAELQQASGAALWASEASASVIATGGDDPEHVLPLRFANWIGIVKYAAARVDHRFKDGETIRVGTSAITAHITPGHTRGCTSYSFAVRDGERALNVVSACSLDVVMGFRYDGYKDDFERTFRVLRSLPADIWVTSHARGWGRYRKFLARDTAKNPVDPFIDPNGYRAYIDDGEDGLRRGVVH